MPDPSAYSHHRSFAADYAVYTYLRKLNGSSADKQRLDREAYLGFKETESFVNSTNLRLRRELSWYPGAERLLSDVKSKIARVLGPFDFNEFANGCEWGPGATASLKSIDSRVDKKILEPQLSVTAAALPYAVAYLKYDTGWLASRCGTQIEGPVSPLLCNFHVVRSSRLTTVDKTIRERRVIDIQPTANLFLQKGLGSMIRRRLKRDGIDLDSQTRNQILAQFALRMNLATVDLSKASDTVSYQLVAEVIPDDWFAIMRDLRTDSTVLPDGSYHYLSKFSAMGNGYTFELESLIFHALCTVVKQYVGVADSVHGVYGDDIIIDRHAVKCLYSAFDLFGFIPNKEKSWSTTLFRESCGKHFFDGHDVTPLYQKVEITSPLELAAAANRLFRWNLRISEGVLDSHLLMPYLLLRDVFGHWVREVAPVIKDRGVYRKFCPLQPYWLEGDDALIDPDWRPRLRDGVWVIDSFDVRPVKEHADQHALYALTLRRMSLRRLTDIEASKGLALLVDPDDAGTPFLGLATRKGGKTVVNLKRRELLSIDRRFPTVV